MRSADVVIIGAGFAGASTAYHLAQRGVRRVLLLEREAIPAFHASGRNASLTFQVLSDPYEARLALEGARFIEEPPDGFADHALLRRTGSLLIAGATGLEALHKSRTMARDLGLPCELLDPKEATRRVPVLGQVNFEHAFWNPSDGVVDIQALIAGYLRGAEGGGVEVRYTRAVTGIRCRGGRVTAVETAEGMIEASCVVNAGGAWAGELGRLAGIDTFALTRRKRHMFHTANDVALDPQAPFVWHNEIDVYFRPEAGGLLMSPCDVTPHAAEDPQATPDGEALLRDKLRRAFPPLAAARINRAWACLRTFAPDERFVIGADPQLEGLIWVAALGGHGMTTSPAVGRLGATAVLGETLPELDYFSPRRF